MSIGSGVFDLWGSKIRGVTFHALAYMIPPPNYNNWPSIFW